jgi:hypothetical protein
MARYNGRAIGFYNQALCNRLCQTALKSEKARRILDPVYFDSLRVETLDDCAKSAATLRSGESTARLRPPGLPKRQAGPRQS